MKDIGSKDYYVRKNKEGKYEISPKLKKVMLNSAQMSGGVLPVGNMGNAAMRTASKLKALSNKEQIFYNQGRNPFKSMIDKRFWDKLMAARAKILGVPR